MTLDTIELLAHRGLWEIRQQRNTRKVIDDALAAGFGIETDVRDFNGEIVISHDPPRDAAFTLRQLLADYKALNSQSTLALNVKSDGLSVPVKELLASFHIERYFVFDMSLPDMLSWDRAGLRFFTRQSEFETNPALYEKSAGVWLDAFHSTWFTRQTIESHLAAGKDVCVVSPELHGRDPAPVWNLLRTVDCIGARLSLCTDLPQQWLATSEGALKQRLSA
jgi:hypothetical protein